MPAARPTASSPQPPLSKPHPHRPATEYANSQREIIRLCAFNQRQLAVLQLLAKGADNKAIAATLGISTATEHKTVRQIMDKLGNASLVTDRNRTAVALFWNGLADDGDSDNANTGI